MALARGAKRAAADVSQVGKVSKAKIDKDLAAKHGCVKAALMASPGTSAELGKMLDVIIPLSLGVPQNERHPFQARLVDAFSKQLRNFDARLKADISDAERQVKDAETLKEQHAAGLDAMGQARASKQASLAESKRSLAQAMSKFRDVRDALGKAEASLNAFDAQHAVASAKLTEAEVAMNDCLQPLKVESVLTTEETGAKRQQLLGFLGSNDVGLDESLMTALPAALEKAPNARGPFDAMTVQEVENLMTARTAAMQLDLQTAGPRKAEMTSYVFTTQTQRDEAAATLRENAATYRALQEDESSILALLCESKGAVKDATSGHRRLTNLLDKATMKLSKFQGGPLSVFGELCEQRSHGNVECTDGDGADSNTVSTEEVAVEPAAAAPEMLAESVPA